MNKAMNKNLDLTKILANVPKGTKLFCTEYGYMEYLCIDGNAVNYPIIVKGKHECIYAFTKDGYSCNKEYRDEFAEQCLFPAHDQRDWNKFEVPTRRVKVTLHPFDKVLVRDGNDKFWLPRFITNYNIDNKLYYVCGDPFGQCVPYNKDTAHLLGTHKDCPIDYEIEFSNEFKED